MTRPPHRRGQHAAAKPHRKALHVMADDVDVDGVWQLLYLFWEQFNKYMDERVRVSFGVFDFV